MVEEKKESYDIYKITTDKQLNKKKIVIIGILIAIVVTLIMILKNSIEIIKEHNIYEQYENQLVALNKQEEDKKIAEEKEIAKKEEQIRQEKIPKLTQERKR